MSQSRETTRRTHVPSSRSEAGHVAGSVAAGFPSAAGFLGVGLFVGDAFVSVFFVDDAFLGDKFISVVSVGSAFVGNAFVGNAFDGDAFVGVAFIVDVFVGVTGADRLDGNRFTSAFFSCPPRCCVALGDGETKRSSSSFSSRLFGRFDGLGFVDKLELAAAVLRTGVVGSASYSESDSGALLRLAGVIGAIAGT